MKRSLAAVLLLAACQGGAPPPPPSKPAPSPVELAASVAESGTVAPPPPPPALRALPSGVPTDAPATADNTPAVREARFVARRAVEAPATLPERWRKALARLDGKLTAAAHERHTAWEKSPAFEEVDLELRTFGSEEENDRRVLAFLRAAALPALGDSLPGPAVHDGDVTWKLGRHPLIAPPGEPREIRYALEYTRDPAEPAQPPSCRKPRTLEVPRLAPDWLRPLLQAGSTRRLVGVRERRGDREDTLRAWLLFHNGDAADEMTGRLGQAAAGAGYRVESGAEGNRQVWRGQGDERLSFRPSNEDLRLGCRVEGPVTSLELVLPRR